MSEDDRDDRKNDDDKARPREGEGGIRDLVDRAMEWLADVLSPTPAPVPVPVPVHNGRRLPPRRR